MCYIDHLVQGRDKITKKNNTDAFISDDGFALGVVFLMRILGVQDDFNSLNWFMSIEKKLERDGLSAKERSAQVQKGGYSEESNFGEELSVKRLEALQREYSMLNFSITASSILFKEI